MEKKRTNSEEIDLFELFGYIKTGINKIGDTLLRFFNFLLRNIVVLGILVLVGIIAGYIIETTSPKRLKTQATLVADFASSDYLYESVEKINSKLMVQDSLFLKKLGLEKETTEGLSLDIEPVVQVREIAGEEENYFSLLSENEILSQEERRALINKLHEQHRLTLFHEKDAPAEKLLLAIINFIRKNPHYKSTFQVMQKSLDRQIKSNIFMLAQIDSLLANYSTARANNPNLVYSQNSLDLGNVLGHRMQMQKETRELQRKKIADSTFLKIIDMNAGQNLEETPLSKIILLPVLLVGLFFLFLLVRILYRKAKTQNSKITQA